MEQMLTEVVDRGRKLYSVDGSCIVNREGISLACYPFPQLVKVKINFDEAQKLKWKEVKCLYGLIKNNNHELLKMQFESRGRNVHTWGTRSGFNSPHAVTTPKSIGGSNMGKFNVCVRLQLI